MALTPNDFQAAVKMVNDLAAENAKLKEEIAALRGQRKAPPPPADEMEPITSTIEEQKQ